MYADHDWFHKYLPDGCYIEPQEDPQGMKLQSSKLEDRFDSLELSQAIWSIKVSEAEKED